jgi:hypothetical protein
MIADFGLWRSGGGRLPGWFTDEFPEFEVETGPKKLTAFILTLVSKM